MHTWDAQLEELASSVVRYASERARLDKDPRWGARSADELTAALADVVAPEGIGGDAALEVFKNVILPACRPNDDPLMVSYVPTAPTPAAVLFDMVVSASSIFAGHWEAGAGAIAAENQALRWIMDIADFPPEAGGVFVSGGTAANLSALVTARESWHASNPERGMGTRLAVAATKNAHASIDVVARVMGVEVLPVDADDRGRLTTQALEQALAAADPALTPFAVVASAGTTNSGAIDDLPALAPFCKERQLWLHVDAAYGGAALASPRYRGLLNGIEQADSFGIDPHKWLFAPYDCAAVLYQQPELAAAAHSQHGDYLGYIERAESNPSDLALHLTRRARGLPLWFSLAANGTSAYAEAIDTTMDTASAVAESVRSIDGLELAVAPRLSVVLFRRTGWEEDDYVAWSERNAAAGTALIVPTRWDGEVCMRVCIVNPLTDAARLHEILLDMAAA